MNRKIREVCSGAVLVHDSKFVLLYNRDKKHYVLPQGHKKKNEKLSETVLREVREETGFQNLSIIRKLGRYQYHFDRGRKTLYKAINVYLIKVIGGKILKNTQNANENFTVHLVTFRNAIKMIRWKQDRKYILLAKKFLRI